MVHRKLIPCIMAAVDLSRSLLGGSDGFCS